MDQRKSAERAVAVEPWMKVAACRVIHGKQPHSDWTGARPPHVPEQACEWTAMTIAEEAAAVLRAAASVARQAALDVLTELRRHAKESAEDDYADSDSAHGGGIYFTVDRLRGSAGAYTDMAKRIDQAIRSLAERSEGEEGE